jgi:hypothetical protein
LGGFSEPDIAELLQSLQDAIAPFVAVGEYVTAAIADSKLGVLDASSRAT